MIFALKSQGAQYFYRVMFVVPMVVPGVVITLIWGFFYDYNLGLLNQTLEALGLGHWKQAWLGDANLAEDVFLAGEQRLQDLSIGHGAVLEAPLLKHRHGQSGNRFDSAANDFPLERVQPFMAPVRQLNERDFFRHRDDVWQGIRAESSEAEGSRGGVAADVAATLSARVRQ